MLQKEIHMTSVREREKRKENTRQGELVRHLMLVLEEFAILRNSC